MNYWFIWCRPYKGPMWHYWIKLTDLFLHSFKMFSVNGKFPRVTWLDFKVFYEKVRNVCTLQCVHFRRTRTHGTCHTISKQGFVWQHFDPNNSRRTLWILITQNGNVTWRLILFPRRSCIHQHNQWGKIGKSTTISTLNSLSKWNTGHK